MLTFLFNANSLVFKQWQEDLISNIKIMIPTLDFVVATKMLSPEIKHRRMFVSERVPNRTE